MTAPLRALAPAKLNLTLRVGPRRADGFHELESLVTWIALADELALTPDPDPLIAGAYFGHEFAPDEVNLVARAADELLARIGGFDAIAARRGSAGAAPGARFELHKHIPVGAGLGGGSSDAAAALKLLNQHWRLELSTDTLAEIGARVGSDVPLFLYESPCVIRGRGERVVPLGAAITGLSVLILPTLHCATRAVYAAFDASRPPVERNASVAPRGGRAAELMPRLFNDLETAAFASFPELARLHAEAERVAGGPVRMSGSGSTLYRLVDEREAAESLAARWRAALRERVVIAQLGTDTP
ncbi:MAG: 4-(cytidine 5'-diphospho)-2-C-methyl-D-erythritol kinase [Phycisphaerae bacterium]